MYVCCPLLNLWTEKLRSVSETWSCFSRFPLNVPDMTDHSRLWMSLFFTSAVLKRKIHANIYSRCTFHILHVNHVALQHIVPNVEKVFSYIYIYNLDAPLDFQDLKNVYLGLAGGKRHDWFRIWIIPNSIDLGCVLLCAAYIGKRESERNKTPEHVWKCPWIWSLGWFSEDLKKFH